MIYFKNNRIFKKSQKCIKVKSLKNKLKMLKGIEKRKGEKFIQNVFKNSKIVFLKCGKFKSICFLF